MTPLQVGEHVTLRDPRWHYWPQKLIVVEVTERDGTPVARLTWADGTGSIVRPVTWLTRGWNE